jgi:hypothetical protein
MKYIRDRRAWQVRAIKITKVIVCVNVEGLPVRGTTCTGLPDMSTRSLRTNLLARGKRNQGF